MKEFGALRAVDGIDLELRGGELVTIFGPNGSGKTTLLRMLSGNLTPTQGLVRVGGEPLANASVRSRIGVLSHQSFLYRDLTARENLLFYARLYALDRRKERVQAELVRVGLEQRGDSKVRTFSRGMRQRLALARTLLHEPDLVLLDEPYTGLDAHAAGVLRDVLASLKDGERTVVLVTHNLTQGLEMADRIMIQVRGRFVWQAARTEVESEGFERTYREVVDRA